MPFKKTDPNLINETRGTLVGHQDILFTKVTQSTWSGSAMSPDTQKPGRCLAEELDGEHKELDWLFHAGHALHRPN